jgi:hypothetical protein
MQIDQKGEEEEAAYHAQARHEEEHSEQRARDGSLDQLCSASVKP